MTDVLTYFFESSISPRLSMALRQLLPPNDDDSEERPLVVPHDTIHESEVVCPSGAIAACAKHDYILVSCPKSSRKKLITSQLASAGVRAVFLGENFVRLPILTQAAKLISNWEELVTKSYRLKRGESYSMAIR